MNSSRFTTLVVTSPDAKVAQAAASGGPLGKLIATAESSQNTMKILSTSDPFNSRCGSGGGTLAALDLTSNDETVLIIHAGGESSRCPTQMALGKAWTSLPCRTGGITDPTTRIVQQLSDLLHDLPDGSVVVAASDTLLTLPIDTGTKMRWKQYEKSVIGLAVPAPLATARNHGVYCLSDSTNTTMCHVERFLQKPSIAEMQQTANCLFQHPATEEDSVWIDTGVVIFLPQSAMALRNLCNGALTCCTERGLLKLHSECKSGESLEDFACSNAYRVELYTHFLLSLSTSGSTSLDDFIASHHDLPVDVLQSIYTSLSSFQLSVMALPHGQFLHLGTSRELVDFMVFGTSPFSSCCAMNEKRCHAFGQDVGLVKRLKSYCVPSNDVAKTAVLVNCVLSSNTCVIGDCSVLEHCFLDVISIKVGKNCLVSGIRGAATQFTIPDNTCFQMLPLLEGGLVYMYLGLMDGIKSGSIYYGIDLSDLLKWTGLSPNDLWNERETKQVLWTANLHPVVFYQRKGAHDDKKEQNMNQLEHEALFSWVTELRAFLPGSEASLSDIGQLSLQRWRAATRLPLNEICHATNAKMEWEYRYHLEDTKFHNAMLHHFNCMKFNLLERRHEESDLDFIVDDFSSTKDAISVRNALAVIDDAIVLAMDKQDYDVASRAFMVASTMLERCAAACYPSIDKAKRDGIDFNFHALSSATIGFEERKVACTKLLSLRNKLLLSCSKERMVEAYGSSSVAMEKAALALTELCVCGTAKFDRRGQNKENSILDKWIIATAPARIDLSGGWSDTPPICYEYGGAVCGVAVTVNGCKPVSCRCRIVKGGEGIMLRTESRNWKNGELESKEETYLRTVSDISDFRDPLAKAALIKCALVYFGLVPMDKLHSGSTENLQIFVNSFCGVDTNVGLEIISTSLLPRGSGMGTSSILAGCILAALAKCVGLDIGIDDDHRFTHVVLMLEQLLTTGGGWQDQIGGLVGGFKLGTSKSKEFPLSTNVERLQVSPLTIDRINDRLVLVFTGQTRLAKNILQNVLRRWARRTKEIVDTVEGLVTDANVVTKALKDGNIAVVADCLNRYWSQKKVMAGAGSGVEPPWVHNVLADLLDEGIVSAGSLCGAGGGGFMVMLSTDGTSANDVRRFVEENIDRFDPHVRGFEWNDCRISMTGLELTVLKNTSDHQGSADWFEITWHQS